MMPVGDTLYYEKDGDLWATSATPGTAHLVKDLSPDTGGPPAGFSSFSAMTAWDRRLAFIADDADTRSLWVTDGTNTRAIADVGRLTTLYALRGGSLLYTAGPREAGAELSAVDPVTLAPSLVGDLKPGPGASRPGAFTEVNGRVYFTANDGTGRRIWSMQGDFDTYTGSGAVGGGSAGSGGGSAGGTGDAGTGSSAKGCGCASTDLLGTSLALAGVLLRRRRPRWRPTRSWEAGR